MTDRVPTDQLRKVRSLNDVLTLLRDDLDWPIDELITGEEAFFDYRPEELGISAERVPDLTSIRELRPLTSHQPWGVFFLELRGPRLPLTPLRRLLERLVEGKRTARSHRTWRARDLMFVITNDSGDAVEFHFVAFFDTGHPAPEIRAISWRPRQSPERHLRRLATEVLPKLSWPDQEAGTPEWSDAWRDAFQLRPGEVIRNADRLSERMAAAAKQLRYQIAGALAEEGGVGPFSDLLEEVRQELVAGVNEERFADMCAQTLVYGTLAARVSDPVAFGASPTLSVVPLTNPFLETFFERVHDQVSVYDDELLEKLVADLKVSNVEAVLDQFGSTAKGGDPVVHFYEAFLKRYDPQARIDSGAFYTPQPVVAFMVRAVDEVLQQRFGMTAGIADTSTWQTVSEHLGVPVPEGMDPQSRFLSMIDPAAGTGTYLVEWVVRARRSFLRRHTREEWPGHLKDFVMPSIHAFELNLAPYSVSHLKAALAVFDQGVEPLVTSAIHLTDTLEYPAAQARFEDMDDPVAQEGKRAALLKQHHRFTVVIGNPPYDREQLVSSPVGHRKGGIVRYGADGVTAPLLNAITDEMRAAGLGVHTKNLYNDYVYFWRWATWQATEHPPGPGVVAFITAASYLDGKSMAGLRGHLRDVFDEVWIVDLGGEGRGAQTEENVFDIRTPVAIAIGIRTTGDASCMVHYRRVTGTREEKFAWLMEGGLTDRTWLEIAGGGLAPLTPSGVGSYFEWPDVTQLFPLIFPGCKAGRTWVIGPSASVLNRRLDGLIATAPRSRQVLFKDSPTGRKCDQRLGNTVMPGNWDRSPVRSMKRRPPIASYAYRSFDRQLVVADPRFLDRASAGWRLVGRHQVFLTTLTSTKLGSGPAAVASPYVPDLDHFRGSYGAKNVMPLWRDRLATEPNITAGLGEVLADEYGYQPSPEDILGYVYGLAGTGAYTERFREELSVAAGPFRVPITSDPRLFEEVACFGCDLLWWHTWGERFSPSNEEQDLPTGRTQELNAVQGYPDRFSYDAGTRELKVGNGKIGPVTPEVWEFDVSGLKVLRSWLGYRMSKKRGKTSSPLDDIRPERWSFTKELLVVITVLQHTVDVTPVARTLLDRVLETRLVELVALPVPTDQERRPPA